MMKLVESGCSSHSFINRNLWARKKYQRKEANLLDSSNKKGCAVSGARNKIVYYADSADSCHNKKITKPFGLGQQQVNGGKLERVSDYKTDNLGASSVLILLVSIWKLGVESSKKEEEKNCEKGG